MNSAALFFRTNFIRLILEKDYDNLCRIIQNMENMGKPILDKNYTNVELIFILNIFLVFFIFRQ